MVLTGVVRPGPVGVAVLASKLDVLHHAVVVLDIVLDIDITKVGANVRPVPGLLTMVHLMMVTRVMTRGRGRLCLGLPGLLLSCGQGALQHRAGGGRGARGGGVRRGEGAGARGGARHGGALGEELSVVRHLVRRHEALWPGARSVVRAGVSGGGGLGQRGQRGVGHMLPIRSGHQGRLGVSWVMMEWRPGVAREPIGSEVGRHPWVRRHPRVHPDPLHHGLVGLAELGPEAVRGRASVGHHVAVILLTRVTGVRPASLLKVFVTQRRDPASGHKLRPVGAGPDPHVVREGEAGRQRGVGEPLHYPVR